MSADPRIDMDVETQLDDHSHPASSLIPSWLTAFPWLEGSDEGLGQGSSPWRASLPLQVFSEDAESSARIRRLADFATEHCRSWPLESLFASIPEKYKLDDLDLNFRSANLLRRESLFTFGDLGALRVKDLFLLRSAGAVTVENILQKLAAANIESIHTSGVEIDAGAGVGAMADQGPAPSSPALDATIHALDVLATWQHIRNRAGEAVLDAEAFALPLPMRVQEAKDHIFSLTANEWDGDGRQARTLSAILTAHLQELSERQQIILRARVLAARPDTLDHVGAKLGVTRERIRQLETVILAQLGSWLSPGTDLAMHASAVRQRVSKLAKLDKVLNEMPALTELIEDTQQPAWYVLDKFDETFESDGEWIAEPTIDALRSEMALRFQQAEIAPGLAPFSAVEGVVSDWRALSSEDLREWMLQCGYRELQDHFIAPSVRSIPDLAVAFLHIVGSSATAQEIHDEVASDRSVSSVRNALGADPRLARVDRQEWGLREWGSREYLGIRDAIAAMVGEKIQVSLDELIRDLTGDFNVSPRSIALYASTWPFETTAGIVRAAQNPKAARKSLSQTRNIYQKGDGWTIRLTVTADHLRGSGFPMPVGLAAAIGLVPGERRSTPAGVESLTTTWSNAQPTFGSIRRHLLQLDCAVGDEIMVDLDSAVACIRKLGPVPSDSDARVRRLMGIQGHGSLRHSEVASALGLAATSPWSSSVHALRDRGETDTVELLISAVGDDPAFDHAFSPGRVSKFSIVSIVEGD